MMKKSLHVFALSASAFITACGGGGSGQGVSSSPSAPVVVAPPPAATTITNPLTGAAAPGAPTTSISAMGVPGAVVTAYMVNPDGSSGAVLGTANAAAGVGGEFTMTLSSTPTGWVRLVARGGKYNRQTDNTFHPVESLELVTPFLTTSFNFLKISPVSDVAARIMTYKAKTGSTLVEAFKFGMVRTLQLDVANVTLQDDTAVYLNVLKGSIQGDRYYDARSLDMAELLSGIERFGVMYDLPQAQVWRAIAAAGEDSYPLATVDGAGAAINVGAWVNGTFDTNVVMSLKTLMNAKTLDEIKVTDGAGARVAPRVSEMVSRYIIQDALADNACTTGFTGAFMSRYPFFALDANGKIPAAICLAVKLRKADFIERTATNNSRNMK